MYDSMRIVDQDGDGVDIVFTPISVRMSQTGTGPYAGLPRQDVRDLRDALNRWLDDQQSRDPNPADQNPRSQDYLGWARKQVDRPLPEPPYEALVRRLVAEELAKVLPLHQAPQAAVPACQCHDTEGNSILRQYATDTGLPFCVDRSCAKPTAHAEHDPEPQAVGHPDAPGIDWTNKLGLRFAYCTECGHSWSRHGVGAGCNARAFDSSGTCGCQTMRSGS